jgi:ribosomal protein S2
MAEYIFGARSNIHIIDLAQSVPMMHRALQAVSDTVAGRARLFVGTKRQRKTPSPKREEIGAYYVNSRWLGGTLTNWKTFPSRSGCAARRNALRQSGYTKKERLTLQREREARPRARWYQGHGRLLDLLFVIDTNKEDIAIRRRAPGLPVAAVVDTNCDQTASLRGGQRRREPRHHAFIATGSEAAIDGIRARKARLASIPAPRRNDAAPRKGSYEVLSDRAALPTSRSCTTCRPRSRRSSTIRHFPLLAARRARSRCAAHDRRMACPVAWKAGSRSRKN